MFLHLSPNQLYRIKVCALGRVGENMFGQIFPNKRNILRGLVYWGIILLPVPLSLPNISFILGLLSFTVFLT